MSDKRKRDAGDALEAHERSRKKQKSGFRVGPQNLPDGTYRRKTQKIKRGLIERAQIKKDYAKLRRKQAEEGGEAENETSAHENGAVPRQDEPPNTAPHPDRQTLMDAEDEDEDLEDAEEEARQEQRGRQYRQKQPKHLPFKREHEAAQKRKAEAEERRLARQEAERQRKEKLEEREKFRRAMAKARTGGPNGQRKLGRESKVLLEKVKRMVGDGGS